MKCRLTLGLNWRAVLAGGILISSGELANSFIQTFISWRICYSQVAVSQIALLCSVPTHSVPPRPPPVSEGLGEIEENIIISHSLWSRNSNYLARTETIRTARYTRNWACELYLNRSFAVSCAINVSSPGDEIVK